MKTADLSQCNTKSKKTLLFVFLCLFFEHFIFSWAAHTGVLSEPRIICHPSSSPNYLMVNWETPLTRRLWLVWDHPAWKLKCIIGDGGVPPPRHRKWRGEPRGSVQAMKSQDETYPESVKMVPAAGRKGALGAALFRIRTNPSATQMELFYFAINPQHLQPIKPHPYAKLRYQQRQAWHCLGMSGTMQSFAPRRSKNAPLV